MAWNMVLTYLHLLDPEDLPLILSKSWKFDSFFPRSSNSNVSFLDDMIPRPPRRSSKTSRISRRAQGQRGPVIATAESPKNHHFSWENPLFLWSFSIATLNYQRVQILEMGLSENRENPYTQWFCWSWSLLFMAISLGVYPIFRHTQMVNLRSLEDLMGIIFPHGKDLEIWWGVFHQSGWSWSWPHIVTSHGESMGIIPIFGCEFQLVKQVNVNYDHSARYTLW